MMSPYVTYIILAITILTSIRSFKDETLKQKLIFNAYLIKQNKEWYRFFSHGVIHADWMHLIFNCYVLYIFGVQVEFDFVLEFGLGKGLFNYVLLYVVGLAVSSFYSYAQNLNNPHYNALGASGAVSGVLFSFIAFNPTVDLSLMFIPIPIKAWVMGLLYLIYSNYMATKKLDNVGHDAHFWGAVFGFVVTFIFKPELFGAFIDQIQDSL